MTGIENQLQRTKMIRCYSPWPDLPVRTIPILHRVYFKKYHVLEMRKWLDVNCGAAWYVAPGWTKNFIDFEDSADATAFALRWA